MKSLYYLLFVLLVTSTVPGPLRGIKADIEPKPGTILTIAGGPSAKKIALTSELSPQSIAADKSGNLYVVDKANAQILRLDAQSHLPRVIAGNGVPGFSGDGGLATDANLLDPQGIAIDDAGNLFIADTGNQRIRKIDASTGVIETIAGDGSARYAGDKGPAGTASFSSPTALAVDQMGNLYVADTANYRIRRIDAVSHLITSVAGNGIEGFSGDKKKAIKASLFFPAGVAVDRNGNLFIADTFNSRVRRVDALTGKISTFAGNGINGYSGDGGPAINANLSQPVGLAVTKSDTLLVADSQNHRIRSIDLKTGIITTIAGNGMMGYSGDGGPAIEASLAYPQAVAPDSFGNVIIADTQNQRVRMVIAVSAGPATVSFDLTSVTPSVAVSAQFTLPLNINVGTSPLGVYTFDLRYNPCILRLDQVNGGTASQFSSSPVANIDNVLGKVVFTADNTSSLTLPTGTVNVAKLVFTALANGTSSLTFQSSSLADTNGNSFVVTITSASVVVGTGVGGCPPTITSFTPTSGAVGASVSITGTNFTGATAVKFNGTAATTFSVLSDTSITATVPSGATTGPISVTAPGGTANSATNFTVTGSGGGAPTVTSFTPTSGPVGTSVTITGTNFTGATAVQFNGTAATTFTVVSDTSITATVPTGATTGVISVTTPGGTGASATNFTVTPTITSFTPTSGSVGTSVSITGTNFTGATAVQFNGPAATFTVVSSTSITATVPTGATTGVISVTTPGGTGTSSTSFTVTSGGGSTATLSFDLSSVTPSVATGTQFTLPLNANVGSSALGTYTIDLRYDPAILRLDQVNGGTASQFSAAPLANIDNTTGRVQFTSDNTSSLTAPTGIVNIARLIFTPLAAGTSSLTFASASMATTSGSPITVTSTAGSVVVSGGGGGGTGAPSITSVTPNSIDGSIDQPIQIFGSNFRNGIVAKILQGTTVIATLQTENVDNNGNRFVARTPRGLASGSFKLQAFNSDGTSSNQVDFTVTGTGGGGGGGVPTITSFAPTSGPVGTSVAIVGTNFTGTTVQFNGVNAVFTVVSSTAITATVPSGASTGPISVTTASGTATSSSNFTVTTTGTGATLSFDLTSVTPSIAPGTQFTLPLNASVGTTPLGVYTIDLRFDPAILRLDQVNGGTASQFSSAPVANIDNTTGKVVFTGDNTSSLTAPTGVVNIARLVFTPLVAGTSGLTFASASLSSTSGAPISVTSVPGSVVVSSGGGGGGGTGAPSITSVTPNSIDGTIDQPIQIFGSNFRTGIVAKILQGTTVIATLQTENVDNNGNRFVARTPRGLAAGSQKVQVFNSDGTSSNQVDFTVTGTGGGGGGGVPTITSFAPTSGPVGTSVAIAGTNFTGTTVQFNGVNAVFTVVSSTAITATVPSGASTGPISVTTASGTATSSINFTVTTTGTGATLSLDLTSVTPSVAPGTQFTLPLNASVGTTPLGVYTIDLRFDPAILRLDQVNGGTASQFSSAPVANIDNTTGKVVFTGDNTSSLTAPTGVVNIARLVFTPLVAGTSGLTFASATLSSTSGVAISVTSVPGSVVVSSGGGGGGGGGGGAASISAVNPSTFSGAIDQSLEILGSNFQSGLAVTITKTGSTTPISLSVETVSNLRNRVVARTPRGLAAGTYSLVVTNAGAAPSAGFTITVN